MAMEGVVQIAIAVGIGVSIFMLGRWGVKLLATGGPPDIDPAATIDVAIDYECTVCGMRLTITQAQDDDVAPPRHCMEPMERTTAASDL